jgi:hypothetical protein
MCEPGSRAHRGTWDSGKTVTPTEGLGRPSVILLPMPSHNAGPPSLMLLECSQRGLRWALLIPLATTGAVVWPDVDVKPVATFRSEPEAVAAFRALDARLAGEGRRARGIMVSDTADVRRGSVLALD